MRCDFHPDPPGSGVILSSRGRTFLEHELSLIGDRVQIGQAREAVLLGQGVSPFWVETFFLSSG